MIAFSRPSGSAEVFVPTADGVATTTSVRDRPLAPSRAGSHYARDVAAEAVNLAIQLKNEVLKSRRYGSFHALQHSLVCDLPFVQPVIVPLLAIRVGVALER